jgi:hypothetical protein
MKTLYMYIHTYMYITHNMSLPKKTPKKPACTLGVNMELFNHDNSGIENKS